MSEHLSSAVKEKQPTLAFAEDGQLTEVDTAETADYYKQKLGRTELSFENFDPAHDRESAHMTATAKLEGLLLDMDERGIDDGAKAEAEAALEAIAALEPDEEHGLSRIGVATKEVERLERWVESFQDSGDRRLESAVSRLNTARLVVDALTDAEDEQTTLSNEAMADATDDESYQSAQFRAQKAMADAHNGLVRRNRYRRSTLKRAS